VGSAETGRALGDRKSVSRFSALGALDRLVLVGFDLRITGARDWLSATPARRLASVSSICAEAGALRRAFPEEIGNALTAEEMDGQHTLDDQAVLAGSADGCFVTKTCSGRLLKEPAVSTNRLFPLIASSFTPTSCVYN
jgi:hypothetical protein